MRDPPPSGSPDTLLGSTLGGYRLDRVIGEGSMGVVFRATRETDGEIVALKVLKRTLSRDDVYRRRFLREAQIAQEVRHKHLVPILEAAEAGGYDFLAVRYVEGGSLADRIEAEGALPLSESVRLAAEVGAGLDALHARGIVHRDVKPSNVMLDSGGRAALTDFGLAKGRAHTVLTKPGQVMGTLDYISPELIQGEGASAASDIYSLGCVVYECLTGVAPFSDRRLFEIAIAHLEAEPPDPSHRNPAIPCEVGAVVAEALSKRAADRPRTGTALAHLLRSAMP